MFKIKQLNSLSDQIFNQGEKPLRWKEARQIERKYLKLILEEWQNFEREFFALIPVEMPPLSEIKTFTYHTTECRCNGCTTPKEKAFNQQDIQDLINRIANYLGTDFVDKFRKLIDKYLNKYWKGGATPDFEGALFQQLYYDSINEGNRKAYEDAWNIARRAGRAYLDQIKLYPEILEISINDPIVRELFETGFELVTSKMTQFFLPESLLIIADGLDNKIPWNQIAVNLRRKVGTGAGWHWRRLVRTEMARSFDKTSENRYKEFGVTVVKWSIVWPGSCPICQEIATRKPEGSTRGGYYRLTNAPKIPDDTHPNDRCRKTPVMNLPDGVIPN